MKEPIDLAQHKMHKDEELTRLEYKSKRIEATMNSLVGANSSDRLVRTASYLRNCQTEDGYWGSPDYPVWHPIMTVQVITLLMRSGMPVDAEWVVTDASGRQRTGSIARALDWLVSAQRKDGSWGEDFWDSCQVIKALVSVGYSSNLPPLAKGVDYLRRVIDEDWRSEVNKQWFGPAFYAAGAEVFFILRDQSLPGKLTEEILSSRDPADGKFCRRELSSDGALSAAAWHTAQVLIGLNTIGALKSTTEIMQSINWLKSVQSDDGSWGAGVDWVKHIYTGHAIAALATLEGSKCESVKKGIKWFLDRQTPNGLIVDLGVTCMAAWTFSQVLVGDLSASLPFTTIFDALDLFRKQYALIQTVRSQNEQLVELEDHSASLAGEISRLRSENSKLQKVMGSLAERTRQQEQIIEALRQEMSSYWIRLTERQVGVIGFIIGLIGIILAVLAFVSR